MEKAKKHNAALLRMKEERAKASCLPGGEEGQQDFYC
jgi:hypothetical protein